MKESTCADRQHSGNGMGRQSDPATMHVVVRGVGDKAKLLRRAVSGQVVPVKLGRRHVRGNEARVAGLKGRPERRCSNGGQSVGAIVIPNEP